MRKTTNLQTLRSILERAIAKQHPVTISYTTASGRDVVRTVEPYGISVSAAGDVLVKTMDRESGEYRSFRLDRLSAYTVHRTSFKIKNPTHLKDVVMAIDSGVPAEETPRPTGLVRHTRYGFTGHVVDSSRAFGASGWSVVVVFTEEFAHLAASGSTRVSEDELVQEPEAPAVPETTVVARYSSRKIWNRTGTRYSDGTLAVFYGCSRIEQYQVTEDASADVWSLVNGLEPTEERVALELGHVVQTIRMADWKGLDGCDVNAAALHLSTMPVDEVSPSDVWRIVRLYTPEKKEITVDVTKGAKEAPEYRTSNGVEIRADLRVEDYDRKEGRVDAHQFTRGGSCDPGGEYFDGWFLIIRDDGSTSLMNGERLRAL